MKIQNKFRTNSKALVINSEQIQRHGGKIQNKFRGAGKNSEQIQMHSQKDLTPEEPTVTITL